MKKLAVITSTRADFGLLLPIIKKLKSFENDTFKVFVIVTGTHLKNEYGHTVDEIIESNVDYETIEIPTDTLSPIDISHNQAIALELFTKHFYEKKYDGALILGDRYEMLSIAIALGNTRTPIFHIGGGDTTEGAIDEWIRHSITKMSYLHFTSNIKSYKRVIQLGEDPNRVFNYGSPGIDNILNIANVDKETALKNIGFINIKSNIKFALCTYHPVTLDVSNISIKINNFLDAIKKFPNIEFIITKSNADQGGEVINNILDKVGKTIKNVHIYSSLGMKNYLSLMRHAEFVIGNSSSGICETPSFHIPTVNIGDRQKGRLRAGSIIDCDDDEMSIVRAINKALSSDFREICKNSISPYGDGMASTKIAEKIYETIMQGNINLMKKFYNIEFII